MDLDEPLINAKGERSSGRPRIAMRDLRKVPINGPGLITVALLVGIWEMLVDADYVRLQFLPAPSQIASALQSLAASGELYSAMRHTVIAAVAGWGIACVGGIFVGLIMGLSRRISVYSMATVEVLRSVPAISFVPVSILIFGFSFRMEMAIIIYVAWWPVLIGTIAGVNRVTVRHQDLARQLQMQTFARIRKIVLPAAAGDILVSMRLALSLSLALAVVTEMIGNPIGVGFQLVLEQQALAPDKVFSYIFIIGILGLLFNTVFVWVTRKLLPGISMSQRDEA